MLFYSSISWFVKAGREQAVPRAGPADAAAARLRRLLRLRAGGPGLGRADGRARRPRLGRGGPQADRRGGGRPLTDWDGNADIDRPDVLASNGLLHDEALRILIKSWHGVTQTEGGRR